MLFASPSSSTTHLSTPRPFASSTSSLRQNNAKSRPPSSLPRPHALCFSGSHRRQPISPLSCLCSPMETPPEFVYSVWALPTDDLAPRLRSLMGGLRSEFGGPRFEPHVTVVGAIGLTEGDAVSRFRAACDGLRAYTATVERVATGTFFYQCVYLLLRPTAEVVETSDHCSAHLGYKRPTPYMPHLSLLYGDLTDEEKKKAQEKANDLDGSLNGLSFLISRLALYKTDTEDKTCQSWEKIAECSLNAS
ncbi:cyclic phosphodiesterase-like [Syzygium oleosum]|uniref:cyclic phosphodiesterase-like n=1 Tax=Syzygium oleosum TaxID=219896 RepID=UPI0011D1C5C9|nr:cyclic phosphodiesterase-like [Syzygium oleosum]